MTQTVSRKKQSALNLIVAIACQLVTLVISFVVPRIILVNYGSDANGLMNSVAQIFTILALLEGGITASAKNELYKHHASNDRANISVVMSGAKNYYKKICIGYFLCVLALAGLCPVIFNTELDFWTIFFFVLFEGLTNIVSFYFINTWSTFLVTSGKNYIVNLVTLANTLLKNGIRIAMALLGASIAFMQVGYFCVSLVIVLIYYLYMRKHYGWIDYKAADKNYRLPDRNSYLVNAIAYTIFSSTDMILLSIFVSTALSSVYSTYGMIYTAFSTIMATVYGAISYNLGLLFHENRDKYLLCHDLLQILKVGGTVILVSVAYWLAIPFVKLYTVGVTDINYVYRWIPLLFGLIQILTTSRQVSSDLVGIAGQAKRIVPVSIIEAILNIVVSLALVFFLDIYGVLIGSVIAAIPKLIWSQKIAERDILQRRPPWSTIKILTVNYLIFGVTILLKELLPEIPIDSYLLFIGYGLGFTAAYTLIVFFSNYCTSPSLRSALKMFGKRNKRSRTTR